jgi:hypothetical protein
MSDISYPGARTVPFGIPGVDVEYGDHICAFHLTTKQRDDILYAYVREGLEAADTCLIAIADNDMQNFRAAVGDTVYENLQVQTYVDGEQRANGDLTADRMMDFWEDTLRGLHEGGAGFARLGGDARWWLGQIAQVEELLFYESELNRHVQRFPLSMLCLYDLNHFGGQTLVELLKTHPKLLIGELLVENPWYMTPDEYRDAILAAQAQGSIA